MGASRRAWRETAAAATGDGNRECLRRTSEGAVSIAEAEGGAAGPAGSVREAKRAAAAKRAREGGDEAAAVVVKKKVDSRKVKTSK